PRVGAFKGGRRRRPRPKRPGGGAGPGRPARVNAAVTLGTSEIRWRPRPEDLRDSRRARPMAKVGAKAFQELHAWSVADGARFWDTALADLGTSWYAPYAKTLDLSGGFAWARWFVGGKTNIV